MNKVPKMISTKDLDYICDALNWNLTNVKKTHHYIKESEDDEIKEIFEKVAEIFNNHYEFLINLLK